MLNDQKHASYWLGNDILLDGVIVDPYKLAVFQRAISNFVRILTKRNIKVTYRSKGVSFTDGKEITISSDISRDKFDSVVGLALHEAAHIVKSDFHYLKQLEENIPDDIWQLGEDKLLPKHEIVKYVHKMWNWVEDRFIDAFICSVAPGYKGYYDSLYARYFNSEKINYHVARRELFTRPKLKSYSFRIINSMNPNSDFDALLGLRKIMTIVDLKNILRLSTDEDRLNIALEICRIVFTNIDSLEKIITKNNKNARADSTIASNKPPKQKSESEHCDDPDKIEENIDDKDEEEENLPNEESKNEEEPQKDSFDGEEDEESKIGNNENDESDETGKIDDSVDNEEHKLDEDIEKQEEFLDGKINKKAISANLKSAIQIIEQACVDIHYIPADVENGLPKFSVVVIKKFDKDVLDSSIFKFKAMHGSNMHLKNIDAIDEGIRLGNGLGHKLRIRNESNTLITTRQRSGKIDRRLIHEFGSGETSLFTRSSVEKFKKVSIHISVDASSSMADGDKWHRTLSCVTAICKAASMVNNIDVVVSLRGVEYLSRNPCVAIVYDSTKDKISKVRSLFQYLCPVGATPEGLCFEALSELISPSSQEVDSYFLNFSDGQPCFTGYMGPQAYLHTQRQVQKLRNKGITIISYYIQINSQYELITRQAFSTMYGSDSNYIDVKNISQVARSLNDKFLQK